MITGPSVGPGMLLTVLMRWPALIAVLAVGGGAVYGYKEYGLPDSVEIALNQVVGKKPVRQISDSDRVKATDHLADAVRPAVAASASMPEPVPIPVLVVSAPIIEKEPELKIEAVEKYLVRPGDNLSKIAMERSHNPVIQKGLIIQMFSDNPHAFKDEDPNQLHADVVISISQVK